MALHMVIMVHGCVRDRGQLEQRIFFIRVATLQLGSGPRYQILSHVFACCASQKTQGQKRIARETRALACPCVFVRFSHVRVFSKRVRFSHVRVFSDSRNVQKKPECDTNHILRATAYLQPTVSLFRLLIQFCCRL